MENVVGLSQPPPRAWIATLASLLPLWLLSFAVMAEGFPSPPVSAEMGFVFAALAVLISIFSFWKRWMPVLFIPYSLLPFAFLYTFDEITTAYKSPFIFLGALILTAGMLLYQRSLGWPKRILFLLLAGGLALFLASNAAGSFWQMTVDLGYGNCFPDHPSCYPLPADATPWWKLFFSP